jgi:hypothetical protein
VAVACRSSFTRVTATTPAIVFVVPDGRAAPLELGAYSLQRSDGFIRSGIADRRGAVFEGAAPRGELRLVVPGPLAR